MSYSRFVLRNKFRAVGQVFSSVPTVPVAKRPNAGSSPQRLRFHFSRRACAAASKRATSAAPSGSTGHTSWRDRCVRGVVARTGAWAQGPMPGRTETR